MLVVALCWGVCKRERERDGMLSVKKKTCMIEPSPCRDHKKSAQVVLKKLTAIGQVGLRFQGPVGC